MWSYIGSLPLTTMGRQSPEAALGPGSNSISRKQTPKSD